MAKGQFLSFTVSASGQLTNVNVVNSSGNSNLDAAAVKAAQSTKASPPPAPSYSASEVLD